MKTTTILIVCLIAIWWLLLTIILIYFHRRCIRNAAILITPEQKKELIELDKSIPLYHMRSFDYLIISPIIFIMLPFYLYGWLVESPCEKQYKA